MVRAVKTMQIQKSRIDEVLQSGMKVFQEIKQPVLRVAVVVVPLLVIYLIFFKHIEVVAPGQGLTGISESNVSLAAPSSGYVVDLVVSEGETIEKDQPLLKFRNLQDEYQLEEVSESLAFEQALLMDFKSEKCFLTSNIFSEGNDLDYGRYHEEQCLGDNAPRGSGGRYILTFYQDYLTEKRYILELEKEQKNKLEELFEKKGITDKRRAIMKRGGGETLRLYELDSELSDINSEIISFSISDLESQKKLSDKFMVFQLRRAERMLTLDDKIRETTASILRKKYQKALLIEKRANAIIRSPVFGSVLELTEGVSSGTFIQEGSPIFVLKKQGASQEVIAKFDSRYRYFLQLERQVKIMTNSTGFNQVFSGVIKEISSDSLPYDQNEQDGKRYYRVTIQPDEKFLSLQLNLGIDVSVMVVEQEITAFEYMSSVVPRDLNFKVW
jgi:epimerase transport system membrane fusion protein